MGGRLDIFSKAGLAKEDPKPEDIEVIEPEVIPQLFTKKEIKEALPEQLRTKVSDSLMEKLNGIASDPDLAKEIRDNFIGFGHVMKEGKFKMEDYLKACAYCTYKFMGYSNQASWGLAFPERLTRMRQENKDDKYISAFVASYARGKLVNMIMDQALVPTHILNQDLYQKALNQQAHLMMNAKSEKVQSDAAKSILDALRQPETSKLEIDVAVKEDHSGIAELRRIMDAAANSQIERIQQGERTRDVAHQKIFDEEGNEVGHPS